MKTVQNLAFAVSLFLASLHPVAVYAASSQNQALELTEGEVKKVDKEAGKVTLKHGDIKNLGMPGMTMVFQVSSKALLDKVQVGDKVAFHAIDKNGKLTVTEIQVTK